MIRPSPRKALALALAATLCAAAPALSFAQAQPAPAASAAMQGSPSQLVLDNTQRVLKTIEARRAEFTKNRAALQSFVSGEFTTMFDRDYAARLVLGVHGRGASEADVKLFSDALADNLMSRYGSSLLDFNTSLRVRVKSETALPGNRGVRVSTQMLRQGGAPILVDYLLRNVNGQWKLFDVMVEGISYVQAFKNQFAAPLNQKPIRQVAADLRAGRMQAAPAPGKTSK